MRAAFRTLKEAPARAGLATDARVDAPAAAAVADPDPFAIAVTESRGFVDSLRGLDLDALLADGPGYDFLFGGAGDFAPLDGFGEPAGDRSGLDRGLSAGPSPLVLPDVAEESLPAKTGGAAQVLPGVIDDDFLFGGDSDLPLVLPAEDDMLLTARSRPDALLLQANHVLVLDLDADGSGGHDASGLPDDGWLF